MISTGKRWIFQLRRFLIEKTIRQPIHFLHIGKTGGTAIKNALHPNLMSSKYFIHLHTHTTTLRDIPAGEPVFFFLRDPVQRFVSGFYSRKRKGRPAYDAPWNDTERLAFTTFDTPNQLAIALTSTDPQLQGIATKAMEAIFHIRHSYWYWFSDIDYFLSRRRDILFVGYQESMEADFERLKIKLGLSPAIQLPEGTTASHQNPTGSDRHLDPAAIKNLQQWYAADYQFISLCRQLIATQENHPAG